MGRGTRSPTIFIVLRYNELFVESRKFFLPHLHLAPNWDYKTVWGNPLEFYYDLWRRKTIPYWAIGDTVSVMTRLTVLIELPTRDRRTDMGP